MVAAVVGALLGWATGGRLGNVGRHPLRAVPLLGAGVVLPVLAELDAFDAVSLGLVLGSMACLLVFCGLNLRLVGMGVVAVGLALNALVMTLNGAMPVRTTALVRAGVADDAGDARGLDLGARRRLERPDDRAAVLGDVLPVAPLRQVLSFGDLVVAAGTTDVVVHLMRRRRSRPAGDRQGGGRQRGGRLPRLWKPTPKRTQRPPSAPGAAGEATPGNSVVSSVATSEPSKRAGRAGASGAPSKASAPAS